MTFGAAVPWAVAQPNVYPEKTVRIIIPYPAGGATDNLGRLAGQALQQALGQTFIADNKGGGGTTIGTRALAQAAPDGYTIGMVDSSFTINPGLLGARLPYDTLKDFAPVSLIATAPFVLVTHPTVPVTDLASFLARAKAAPGTMAYGSAGVGSGPHLAGEQLAQLAGIQVQHIPYKGGGTVITDLLGGQFQFAFATVPTLAEHINAGRLRAIAVTSAQRVPQLPNVPTFREAGLPGVDTSPLFGLIAPAGVSVAIVERLSATLRASINQGELNTRLKSMGFEPVGSTPAEFNQRIQAEVVKWTAVIRKGNIQPE
ncbi:tripartite tricarboxylate transporter substrate binding protein [Variovorax fucosicus]|uniref:tripartite tricarboxylate transporter substrate binding protein n=1 Tax=Variovorax fucosicus TaxID=3053517 RepID=UPI0025755DE9|nr:tripartite tricarboxylate transporter substrate binding protein [Variovorax sp. J22G47]MDM0058464.1 tripartite tricarboxylate transporter substrate binding protein [Variovorax sp. J22G47]